MELDTAPGVSTSSPTPLSLIIRTGDVCGDLRSSAMLSSVAVQVEEEEEFLLELLDPLRWDRQVVPKRR